MDVDGSDLTTVTYGYAPSWSPDGLRLAFSTYDFPAAVGVVDADGSDRQVVVSAPGVEYRRPHWSPDGTRLVVFNVRTGDIQWNLLYPSGVTILSVKDGTVILNSKDQQGPFDLDGRRIGKPK